MHAPQQQQQRRRKKRPVPHGLKTVEIGRGRSGYGFTISGQHPCILSCVVAGSPAERAGLRTGDFVMSVNNQDVSQANHDDVVRLIGSSTGVLVVQIVENNYSSASSDDENYTKKQKAKYPHRNRPRHSNNANSDGNKANRAEKVLADLESGALFTEPLPVVGKQGHQHRRGVTHNGLPQKNRSHSPDVERVLRANQRARSPELDRFARANHRSHSPDVERFLRERYRSHSPEADKYLKSRQRSHSPDVERYLREQQRNYEQRQGYHHQRSKTNHLPVGNGHLQDRPLNNGLQQERKSRRDIIEPGPFSGNRNNVPVQVHAAMSAQAAGPSVDQRPKVRGNQAAASQEQRPRGRGNTAGACASGEQRPKVRTNPEGAKSPISPAGYQTVFTPQELSNILYPSLQPHLDPLNGLDDNLPQAAENNRDNELNLRVVVGYVGSIEMPSDSNMPNSRLQSIRSAIRRLRVEQKIHTLVLMEVFSDGVKLTNSMGMTVAHYPADRLAFSGVCPDDKRFFGLVTMHSASSDEISSDNGSQAEEEQHGSSCHVFMVDPELRAHNIHAKKAKAFGFQCTHDPETNKCLEFPRSATPILRTVAKLYKDRVGGLYEAEIARANMFADPNVAAHRSNSNSSNSDSGLGFWREDGSNGDMVYVVDMPHYNHEYGHHPRWFYDRQAAGSPPPPGPHGHRSGQPDHGRALSPPPPPPPQHHHHHRSGPSEPGHAFRRVEQRKSSDSTSPQSAGSTQVSPSGANPPVLDRLNLRAMPDPNVHKLSPSRESLDARTSAENLRKSMHKYLQTRQKIVVDTNQQTSSDQESHKSSVDLTSKDGHVSGPPQQDAKFNLKQRPLSCPIENTPLMPHVPRVGALKVETVDLANKLSPRACITPGPDMFKAANFHSNSTNSINEITPTNTTASSSTEKQSDLDMPDALDVPEERNEKKHKKKKNSNDGEFKIPSHPVKQNNNKSKQKDENTRESLPSSSSNSNQAAVQKMVARFEKEKPIPPKKPDLTKRNLPVSANSKADAEISQDSDKLKQTQGDGDKLSRGDGYSQKNPNRMSHDGASQRDPQPPPNGASRGGVQENHKDQSQKAAHPHLEVRRFSEVTIPNFKQPEDDPHWRRSSQGAFKKQSSAPKMPHSQSHESLAISDAEFPLSGKMASASSVTSVASDASIHVDVCQSDLGRVAGWAVSFEKLLADPAGQATFTEFLKKEFSEENMLFWITCEKFKKISSPAQMKVRAQEIFSCHLATGATEPVNIDSVARKRAAECLENPVPDMFDMSQQQIFRLMKTDSYVRFLKSDMYKECVVAEMEGRHLPYQPEDSDEDKRKLRKKASTDGEEDGKRRKSLLPWKGKGSKRPSGKGSTGSTSDSERKGTMKSSLASADLSMMSKEITGSQESLNKDDTSSQGDNKENYKLCRVILPDGATTVIYAKPGQTVKDAVLSLCEKRGLILATLDVLIVGSEKALDLRKDISSLGSKEIKLESRVLFRLDMPNNKSIGVKAKPTRTVKEVFKPILNKYGYKIENMAMFVAGLGHPLDPNMLVSVVENQRVIVQPAEDFAEWGGGYELHRTSIGKPPLPRQRHSVPAPPLASKEDASGNAFQEMIEGKGDCLNGFDELGILDLDRNAKTDDRSSSNRSSGIFSLIRRNSVGDKIQSKKSKEKVGIPTSSSANSGIATQRNSMIKKDGANGTAVKKKRSNAEDASFKQLVSGVKAMQTSRLDDQRGLLLSQPELPDFLKKPAHSSSDKENSPNAGNRHSEIFPQRQESEPSYIYGGGPSSQDSIDSHLMKSTSQPSLASDHSSRSAGSRGSSSSTGDRRSLKTFHTFGHLSPGDFPAHLDTSFSGEGILPSHLEAEEYFDQAYRYPSELNERGLSDYDLDSSAHSSLFTNSQSRDSFPFHGDSQDSFPMGHPGGDRFSYGSDCRSSSSSRGSVGNSKRTTTTRSYSEDPGNYKLADNRFSMEDKNVGKTKPPPPPPKPQRSLSQQDSSPQTPKAYSRVFEEISSPVTPGLNRTVIENYTEITEADLDATLIAAQQSPRPDSVPPPPPSVMDGSLTEFQEADFPPPPPVTGNTGKPWEISIIQHDSGGEEQFRSPYSRRFPRSQSCEAQKGGKETHVLQNTRGRSSSYHHHSSFSDEGDIGTDTEPANCSAETTSNTSRLSPPASTPSPTTHDLLPLDSPSPKARTRLDFTSNAYNPNPAAASHAIKYNHHSAYSGQGRQPSVQPAPSYHSTTGGSTYPALQRSPVGVSAVQNRQPAPYVPPPSYSKSMARPELRTAAVRKTGVSSGPYDQGQQRSDVKITFV
ncbi:uncharacterized protein LOC106173091 isoform X2 [Lingula anatina]|uniref:Uncharacterized protein LOC106173091 isoform X2 n=1 Tax=Lingula anatina TaxID=7574 RepID=A0A1S3JI08_LINAN|nr:uncharacterized protein LOC106173091 isoform X2 [Lingula anatina]|eukprot:XP_013409534.1 uncharacterized protein LOC106173091 isoform X2 [Lingula anatina]